MNPTRQYFRSCAYCAALLLCGILAGCSDQDSGETGSVAQPQVAGSGVPGPVGSSAAAKGLIAVGLGMAGDYAILAKTAITASGISTITGRVGLSPARAEAITGLSLSTTPDSFAISPQVSGQVFAADYRASTPANLASAVGDMEAAYADAAGRQPEYLDLGSGIIGGLTLLPATYKWTTALLIPTSITLNGGVKDIWIFQVAQGVTQSAATRVILTGGASPKNIFWQVGGKVEIGEKAHIEGIILSRSSIIFGSGATANSRLLSQAAVNLGGGNVIVPAP